MTQAQYDEIAEWYDEQVRTTLGPFHALAIGALLDLAGDVRGLEVCDLACGQGILSRELARRGANVAGVDISERLLTLARQHGDAATAAITYRHDDAQSLTTLPDASFDLVTCNLALMDIPDLPAVCAAVRRVLRPGGAFVFSITHPCTLSPSSKWTTEAEGGPGSHVRGYFEEGYAVPPHAPGVRGRVGTHHRTLATYLNTLTDTGLQLHRLAEPRASGDAAERQPAAVEVPAFLVARCVAS
ncbi:MAG TPA: class I SAM-dependent methyltransferase [Ktedonobacterales bacterium]